MGRDKAQLTINGQTFLERCQRQLGELGCDTYLVSSNQLEGAIPDRFEHIGPVAGIAACVGELDSRNFRGDLIIIPVDMLMLSSASLSRLRRALQDAECAHYDNFPLPLALSITADTHQRIESLCEEALASGGISIKAFTTAFKTTSLVPTSQQLSEFYNCNTPEELEHLTCVCNESESQE